RHVAYIVPDRVRDGYGLTAPIAQRVKDSGADVLITVDNGIASIDGVAQARALGLQVLVTDHHLPGDVLPPADAIVNPNRRGDGFASKALAGVGVVFYVLLALRRHLRDGGAFEGDAPDLSVLLDLVAVGTVADLVPLDANNRARVAAGLRRLRAGKGCAGLHALIEVSGRTAATLTAADIGFAVAPRINAAGRLEDMALGIECLLTDDAARARELAELLHGINAERRGVQQMMVDDAVAALAVIPAQAGGEVPVAVCLHHPDWHPGVVGLVASKLKERLHRPVIAFAPSEPGSDSLRGSARSIPGLHIRDVLAVVDSTHPGLVERFGGHAMAAGMSLRRGHLDVFKQAFVEAVRSVLDPALLDAEVVSDGELAPQEFDRFHADAIRDGGPWGQGFPEPLFDGEFEVLDWRVVGERHLKLVLRGDGLPAPLNAIHFGGWTGERPAPRCHLAYRLAPDDYRGARAVQLIVEHLAAA
ncbi:MAG: single-stranded-DNA-specific exonuclease RecJ, partial [Luteimonas sp.]|nr:single-stranded-DNA-specific exonuclease RecJ [Luteimonas sp.]